MAWTETSDDPVVQLLLRVGKPITRAAHHEPDVVGGSVTLERRRDRAHELHRQLPRGGAGYRGLALPQKETTMMRYRCTGCGISFTAPRKNYKPLVCPCCNRRDKDFGGNLFVCLGNAPAPDTVPKEASSCPHCHKRDEDGKLFRCLNYPRGRS
jgi:hypothetical protein